MDTKKIIKQYDKYVIGNYSRLPLVFVRGQGSYVWDADGKRYLDMFPGWAVSGLGHCPQPVVEAIRKQAGELIHMDNTFYTVPQGRLARLISKKSFGGKSFFCNSGTEAVEAALKLARLATPEKKYRYITALGSFHGRTFAALTATAQSKHHQGLSPLLPGFSYVPFNDVSALEETFDDEVAAVLLEPIQGEGGINVASDEFLIKAAELCRQHNALLILDEVQSGMGRTGKWFAYQHTPIEPDIITMAKSLGGGVAIGGICASPQVAEALKPGTHASTFGGNPLAAAAAVAAIEMIDSEGLLARAAELG
ncbi:MAG: aminotransferase class III-fold pyridoxal phosphate-dependent enzyme, partial [Phycisphaerae bacterium]|nr:aminotransferase class III-fold pyridoxal phosphate-dependent enzyme [Phycisphaerae bacterium]